MYSSGLEIEVYKFGTLVGFCDPLVSPLNQAESVCNNMIGNKIVIKRKCPFDARTCSLGLCGGGVLSDCDCS
jgi:hypothetical protein